MKTLLLTLLLLLAITAAWAQAPQRISYQSIIRDANNVVVASSAISVKISLLRGTATGPAVYVETHPITTNANGLVSLNIGEGTAITGSFAGIDWSNGPYLIQTATDPTGGTDYSIIGIAPLNSVPYALNAANASVATTLAGTLAIASGGTGATTATAARAALGLENVDNTSDANKPVSTATQTSLAAKVDKVTGKELSTNDYSTAEKAKLAAITGNNTGDQDLSSFATSSQLATKVDKVNGKELSTNDYSTVEKAKLTAITGSNTGDQVNIVGNAATATKLQATVTINGIAFDGSSNITLPSAAAGIPYTGATQAVDLGAYDLKVNGLTVGRGSGNKSSNTASGVNALYANTSGSENTASGSRALSNNTIGNYNTATGSGVLVSNTEGSSNTASGRYALYKNTTGNYNTATGYTALYSNTTGSYNTAIGPSALYKNTTGAANTATGYIALYNNTTGTDNTANGLEALYSNTTGLANLASGNYALYSNTTGNYNTASGNSALFANTTGSNNTAIGNGAGVGSAALTNATAIGNGAIVNASNTIQLGDAYVAKVITSGTLTAGTVTYPNAHNSTAGQALTTNALGVASWTTPHYLGEAFNGGIIFYLYKGSDGLEHGLIVALTESTAKWQTTGTLVNADRTEDGAFNTNRMTGSPAKDYIAGLGAGWYLPSIDELALLYENRYSAQKGLRGVGNTPLHTLLSNTEYYWSSTDWTDSRAFYFNFFNGYVNYNFKTTTYYVRGVRAF